MVRPVTKKLSAARSKFKQRVIDFIKLLGAVEHDGMYPYKLDTPIGEISIDVWDDAIMCRFWDVAKGREFTDRFTSQACNPYRGKWNWHFSDDAETLNSECEAEFVRDMTTLMSLDDLPQDLSTLTGEQTEECVGKLADLSLPELRRRQDLTQKQIAVAHNLRNDLALADLHVRAEHLRIAVDRKTFGDGL
jgi:hypothetical protein